MNIFYAVWALWFGSEIYLNRRFRSKEQDLKGKDKGSIRVIWATIFVANMFAGFVSSKGITRISHGELLPYIGLGLTVVGMLLRFYAIWSLGKYFTVDVTITEGHRVKRDGIYSVIRHPSYTGMLISFVGFGLTLNTYAGLAAIVILVGASVLYRIRIEEEVLIESFGNEYRDYMKHTSRLIPWIY